MIHSMRGCATTTRSTRGPPRSCQDRPKLSKGPALPWPATSGQRTTCVRHQVRRRIQPVPAGCQTVKLLQTKCARERGSPRVITGPALPPPLCCPRHNSDWHYNVSDRSHDLERNGALGGRTLDRETDAKLEPVNHHRPNRAVDGAVPWWEAHLENPIHCTSGGPLSNTGAITGVAPGATRAVAITLRNAPTSSSALSTSGGERRPGRQMPVI